MTDQMPTDHIRWRIHLASPPEAVYEALSTNGGRASFWAESAIETGGQIEFRFSDGTVFESRVLEERPPNLYAVEYFGGSRAEFQMDEDGAGGTDLMLIESGVPEENLPIHQSGWIPVLLTLKAAVDFTVDLRNPDPERDWDAGYVDV